MMIRKSPEITVEESRAIDAAAVEALGVSSLLLMENAARGVCESINRNFDVSAPKLIACGFGNNGGDGLSLARLLAAEGCEATTYLIDAGHPLTSDAETNLGLLEKCGIPLIRDSYGEQLQQDVLSLQENALVVDCLLGTGIQGNLRAPYAETVEAINRSVAQVLAVDVPSGLNAQTGHPGHPTIIANRTITFVGMKSGFKSATATTYTGDIEVAPIGIPLSWTMNFLQKRRRQAPNT